ncbi:MAG: universal stress protein [Pseudomonadales bacterium]
MAYKHILAAVDLSEESIQVLDKAHATAQAHGARLSLVTVVKPLTQVYGGLDMAPISSGAVSFEEEALKAAAAQLRDLAQRYDVPAADTRVVLGAPAHEIRALAEELGVDLIVMGTHGRHGLGRLLGSTASGVLHGVACDVLAVRVRFPE